jgi:hypothetical protein
VQARFIFDEDWWLDAACPGAWDRIQVSWDGALVGEMSFHIKRRWGLSYISMPHLTRTMSPLLSPPSHKPVSRTIECQTIVGELLSQLPRHDRFERALNPDCPSVQGFAHANFAVTHMFTFRSRPGDGPETLLQNAHQKTRRIISRAQRECSVERSAEILRFIALHRKSYGEDSLVNYAVLQRIFESALSRQQTEIIFVRTEDQVDTAAIILIWDHETVYYWLVARDRKTNYIGANSLLVFEAMRTASRLGLRLDLDGYVKPAVGAFLTKFGLTPCVRPYVNGGSGLWQALRATTSFFNRDRPDRFFRVS